MGKAESIAEYCLKQQWTNRFADVRFLAAGEYNENWLVDDGSGKPRVFRINRGSQLGLGEAQIAYEFRVLQLLMSSGVTPIPYCCDCSPQATVPAIDGGCLFMEYLEGGPLDYAKDAWKAAEIFAMVHNQPVSSIPEEHGLIVQDDPVGDIIRECDELLSRQPDHPRKVVRNRLLEYRETVSGLREETLPLFATEPLVIANTEVNSGNFCISDTTAGLVDWEKAVVTSRYQDLGHFLVPTTTRWKTDFTFDARSRETFLRRYMGAAGLQDSYETVSRKTEVMERTILLRAFSWCYMAWYEYTRQDRALQNEETFRTIERYLDTMECFLA